MEVPATARIPRFGVFELDPASGELRKNGVKIRLADQPFQILLLLLDRRGQVVTRQELRRRLWTTDTFVDFDVGLNTAVRKLREALGDSAENPRFIETLPRRGYRFIGPVQPQTPEPIQIPGPNGTAAARVRRHATVVAGGGLVLVVLLIGTFVLGYESKWWKWAATETAVQHIGSLAVLPFDNLTGDPAQEYFVTAVTDALTTELAQVGGLQVISRTSASQYKGAKKPLRTVGQELNVDAVVEGAIVRTGQRLHITAQLIQAATDRHIWAKSYDSENGDVIALQLEIARGIASALDRPLTSAADRPGIPRGVRPDAYDAYLKGLFASGQESFEGFRTGIAYFEDAVTKQPDFALAYAAIAQAQLQFLYTGPLSPRETIPKAEAAVRKALELDETLAPAHRTLGLILQRFHWRWDEAAAEFRRDRQLSGGIELPTFQPSARGRNAEERIAEAERLRRLDPLSFNASVAVAEAYRGARQYDRAIAELRRALEIEPERGRGHFQLAVTLMESGRLKEAISELEIAVKSEANQRFQAYLGYAYAVAGQPEDARRVLSMLESRARHQYISSFGLALIHDALGEKQATLAALDRAYQDRAVEFAMMAQYPPFRTVAADPQYVALMRRVGLPGQVPKGMR